MCPKNNFHGKPNPKQILTFLKKKNCSRNEIVYIGDMKVDKLTAKNAKIDYIHASYGYSKKINNRYSINKIDEIITKKFGLN